MRLWLLAVIVSACTAPTSELVSSTTAAAPPSSTASPSSFVTTVTTTATSSTTTQSTAPLTGLAYRELASGLPFPVVAVAPIDDPRLFVATKDGRVWVMVGGDLVEEPFLDLHREVIDSGERGLLGLAFPPDYAETGRFYVHFSAVEDGATMLMRFATSSDPNRADPDSGELLLRVEQPASNHNGGGLEFGPDGYLYLGLGDGGGGGDTFDNGQNRESLLAKILRLDVSVPSGFGIPPDNPWVEGGGVAEAWAWGLRNPWRFSFDSAEGVIYIGDVGQNAFEEIDAAPADRGGINYGWPITEALHCFRPAQDCDPVGITPPVMEIEHGDAGACSVTGGIVYRGLEIPELVGHYFYSDYCGGWLRSFRLDNELTTEVRDWTEDVGVPGRVTSFGTDAAGELYVLTTDAVYQVVPVR